MLILAGAGSGKTRVITYRIAHLIENLGAMPESILAVTFTNKAAAEMAERVDKIVGGSSIAKPVISTFHSFCVRVLRRDIEAHADSVCCAGHPPIGHTKSFVIYDESDQQQWTKSIMKRLGIDDKETHAARSAVPYFVGEEPHARSAGGLSATRRTRRPNAVAHIYEEYRKELRKANAMDFDDLLLEAVRLLKVVGDSPRVLQPEVSVHLGG